MPKRIEAAEAEVQLAHGPAPRRLGRGPRRHGVGRERSEFVPAARSALRAECCDTTTCANLEIHGAVYACRARIQSVFADDFGGSVFHIPLAERRRRLLAVDWVENASVSRVWPRPDRRDRHGAHPVAFAKLPIAASGRFRFALIDKDGVLLRFRRASRFRLPVLSGVTEEQTEAERARARERPCSICSSDLGPQATDISEINAADNLDMRVIVEIDRPRRRTLDRRSALSLAIPEFRQSLRRDPQALRARRRVFDLRLDDRILAK